MSTNENNTRKTVKKTLSANDVRAHKNLYAIWQAYKAKHKVSQTDFAEDKLGWSQGNFSQYLTGQVAIGNKALATLCEALGCSPWEIREELADQRLVNEHDIYKTAVTDLVALDNLPQEAWDIINAAQNQINMLNEDQESEQNIAA